MPFSRKELEAALDAIKGKRIAVIGDLMLDRYIWGTVSRISPEAPVPVVDVKEDSERPGGAGNVVLNLLSLGAESEPVGLIGEDIHGSTLKQLLADAGSSIDGLVASKKRPTTAKTRVFAEQQHVVRVDREITDSLEPELERELGQRIVEAIGRADAVILQDYNKGALTAGLIKTSIDAAHRRDIPITVDPKNNNFFEYQQATVFKPNLREAERALGRKLWDNNDIERGGNELLLRLQAENVLLTRGSAGMSLFGPAEPVEHIPTRARGVADVSGAGDTVISTLTLGLVAGFSASKSAHLATLAAGYVVGQVGVVPVTREALLDESGD
jgi:rfaE bifunctional protein kinase chain/domain